MLHHETLPLGHKCKEPMAFLPWFWMSVSFVMGFRMLVADSLLRAKTMQSWWLGVQITVYCEIKKKKNNVQVDV